jgi:hypothetical protein
MRKLTFALVASLSFLLTAVSCKDKVEKAVSEAVADAQVLDMTSEERTLAALEDLLEFMKDIKIETQDDVLKSNLELEAFKSKLEKKYGANFMNSDEYDSLHFTREQEQKLQDLTLDMMQEATRLGREQASVMN